MQIRVGTSCIQSNSINMLITLYEVSITSPNNSEHNIINII